MKRTFQFALAVAASAALFSSAHASTITIETGSSTADVQNSAAAYQATVNAALTHSTTVSDYAYLSNQSLFGTGNSNYAFKSTVNFGVSAANAGNWEISTAVDFGKGGAIYIDGVSYGYKTGDLWAANDFANVTNNGFTVSLALSAGNHTLNVYGLENCCDGGQNAQFKIGNGVATTFSAHDGLIAAVPEPETYAMMLAGLGLVGFMSRRKKAKKAA